MAELVYMKKAARVRGSIELVTFGTLLDYSSKPYPREFLESNPEVVSFVQSGMIELVSAADREREITDRRTAAAAALEADDDDSATTPEQKVNSAPTVEDALASDSPTTAQMARAVADAKSALGRLEALIVAALPQSSKVVDKVVDKSVPKVAAAEAQPVDDGLDLPMNAPVGMKPQTATVGYLKKNAKERRLFLTQCRDITTLRDIAMFESDPRLKKMARKAARAAEQSAEMASASAEALGM